MKPKADTAKDRSKVTLADLLESDRRQYPREDVQLTLSEFASANPVAGAGDEAVQVSGPGAAFSLSLRDHHVTLPTRAAPLYRRRL